MVLQIIFNLVSPENKAAFRKLENFEKKKIITQLHREFNQIYIYRYIWAAANTDTWGWWWHYNIYNTYNIYIILTCIYSIYEKLQRLTLGGGGDIASAAAPSGVGEHLVGGAVDVEGGAVLLHGNGGHRILAGNTQFNLL